MRRKRIYGRRRKRTPILNTKSEVTEFAAKKGATEVGKAGLLGNAGKVASRAAAPVGVASLLYGFYKSGQKHSSGKAVKGQESFMDKATTEQGKKGSIWGKK